MWTDLTQSFSGDMPHSEAVPGPDFETVLSVEEDGVNVQYYSVPTHVGTHVDAPKHFFEDGQTIDSLSLDRFAGEGVVLDVTTEEPTEITLEDVESAEGRVTADDIVLLHTGWGEKYGTGAYDPHPWLATDVAEWFVDRGVKMVGVDTITHDLPGPKRPDGWREWPVHRTLLENGVLTAQHLANLGEFAGTRLEIFGFPIKIRDGDGAPARFVARELE